MYILFHKHSRWWILSKEEILEGLGGLEIALEVARQHGIVISEIVV